MDVGGGGDVGSWSVMKRFGKIKVVESERRIKSDGKIGENGRKLRIKKNLKNKEVENNRKNKKLKMIIEDKRNNYIKMENVYKK
jgi:hypothetical protein